MKPQAIICVLLLFVIVAGLSDGLLAQKLTYPTARKDTVVDDYFGTKVPAPYRWMEDESSPELRRWIEAENGLTFGYLEQIPFRLKIKARLEQLLNYARYSVPTRKGQWYFYSKNDGLQNQSVVYKQAKLGGESTVVIDPQRGWYRGTHGANVHEKWNPACLRPLE
jgi:prolyl oligopeptidase